MLKILAVFFIRSLSRTAFDVGLAFAIICLALKWDVYGAIIGVCIAAFFSLLNQFVVLPDELELANAWKQESEPGIA
jgi:hypothetical protein